MTETWSDWTGQAEDTMMLMTRQDLVATLQAEGIWVTPSAIAYWERVGVLPRAFRRWRDNGPKALYPEVALPVMRTIRFMQFRGATLDDIRAFLRPALAAT